MRRKFSLVLTLCAWLVATGSHLDVAQTFAWGRMLAANTAEMPFLAAVKKTFSPEGRCPLCVAIAAARQQHDHETANGEMAQNPFPREILLMMAPEAEMFLAPKLSQPSIFPKRKLLASVQRAAPLLTPPRARA